MATAYFISADKLKTDTVINGNVDNKLLNPTILEVQDLRIKRLLGTDLFNELVTQINANAVTSLNATLLQNYIQPALKYYVLANFCVPGVYKFMNKSVMTKSSEYGSPLTVEELNSTRDYYNGLAQTYAKEIERYLCANSDDYPLYLNGNETGDKQRPKKNTYFPGVVLTRTTYRGNRYGPGYPYTNSALDNGANEYCYDC